MNRNVCDAQNREQRGGERKRGMKDSGGREDRRGRDGWMRESLKARTTKSERYELGERQKDRRGSALWTVGSG